MSKRESRTYDLEYKKRIVQEYLAGKPAIQIGVDEGFVPGLVYRWKSMLENQERSDRIEEIQETTGASLDQAKKIRELEEELLAAKEKIADQAMIIDLLKKNRPSFQFEKKSSGYIETKRELGRKRGPAK